MTKPTRQMTKRGTELLIAREGSRSKMYLDSAGLPTIGVGHLLTRSELSSGKLYINGIAVRWRDGLSNDQIVHLFDHDNDVAETAVDSLIKVELADHQFDALASFTFNVGVDALRRSSLRRLLNAGDYAVVPDQLRRWIYAAGQPVLRNRREEEVRQWMTPYAA
ncbi:Phage-related lysozyme (muraminidase) [Cardiobacterium hominis]|uniref:Lysozyme n=1 Tax=Cardiobacterium hominis (strain ATCC 15826 / DSM 8339 / NCTC 10426 / 6573) TaxID=638300 RepID=C8NCA4_CARH6|nr:lysozyme [Cardiobacterium hominis]EEV87738.1 phage lysozyme [Cardiobacterium hominis ATCC 15826]VEG77570.1 Phage-related lysozyme (muraminidase) [Cardiobacterium hominis]